MAELAIPTARVVLQGSISIPPQATGIVVFAHGSGSSRFSPRNRFVARILEQHGIGTLLLDLLTMDEERIDSTTRHLRFDLPLLAARIEGIADWLNNHAMYRMFHLGLFGASTGGGAALIAAAERPDLIHAVVSRGGRPDLAGPFLSQVKCPTLLVVGEHDETVMALNRQALQRLNPDSMLETIPRATHLFEEHGALEQVANLAAAWFHRYLI